MKKIQIYYGIFLSDKTKQAILEHVKHWFYENFDKYHTDDFTITELEYYDDENKEAEQYYNN